MDPLQSLLERNLHFLAGGAIIGIAACGLLWFQGRIAGISGIVGGLLDRRKDDAGWRIGFISGLLTGGMTAMIYAPRSLGMPPQNRSLGLLAVAGLLIGIGTGLAQGCTSGHGICGLARRSQRSLVATALFMLSGIMTATAYAYFRTSP